MLQLNRFMRHIFIPLYKLDMNKQYNHRRESRDHLVQLHLYRETLLLTSQCFFLCQRSSLNITPGFSLLIPGSFIWLVNLEE